MIADGAGGLAAADGLAGRRHGLAVASWLPASVGGPAPRAGCREQASMAIEDGFTGNETGLPAIENEVNRL